MTQKTTPAIDALTAEYEALRGVRTTEARSRSCEVWNARAALLLALNGPRKVAAYASRAGQRQAAERRARYP